MTTARESATDRSTPTSARYLLVGVGSAIVGLLPWLLTGMRLPLQNLWAVETLPWDMPFALLPFSQYALGLLPAVIIVGSATAGIFARAMRERLPRRGLAWIVAGVVGFQVLATIQTTLTVASGLRDGTASDLYLGALVAGSVVAVLIGFLVLMLVARAAVPGAVIGLTIAAVLLASWLSAIGPPFGNLPYELNGPFLRVIYWAPAVAVALVLVWAGLMTAARVWAAIVTLLVLWVAPAAITAVGAAVGSRVLLVRPTELLEFARLLFFTELGPNGRSTPLVLTAIILTAIGLVVRWAVQRRRGARVAPSDA